MLKSLTNILKANINFDAINRDFSIVRFKAVGEEKYISSKAFNDPNCNFISTKYNSGKWGFALMEKDSFCDLRDIEFKDLSYEKILAEDAVYYGTLIQLFINALANTLFDYNNITGSCYKLYNCKSNFLDAYEFKVVSKDEFLYLTCSCTRFSKSKGKKSNAYFSLSSDEKSLKREFYLEKGKQYYIHSGESNKKASSPFLVIKYGDGRAKAMQDLLNKFNEKFGNYINLEFQFLDIAEKKVFSENKIEKIIDKVIKNYKFSLVDYVGDKQNDVYIKSVINEFKKIYKLNISIVSKPKKGNINFIIIKPKEYYENKNIPDPHKMIASDIITQCIQDDTLHLLLDAKGTFSPTMLTIIKEAIIKADIIMNHKITIDDWASYKFQNDWIFILKHKNVSDKQFQQNSFYKMIIHPNGEFEMIEILDDLFHSTTDKLLDLFSENKDVEALVMDDCNNINKIARTDIITMPTNEILGNFISRSRKNMENNYPGLCDINYYDFLGNVYYNAGQDLKSVNGKFAKASHLYKILFVKDSKNVIKDIMSLMSVGFVKYNNLTVLPYPIKYLREYINLYDR